MSPLGVKYLKQKVGYSKSSENCVQISRDGVGRLSVLKRNPPVIDHG